MRKLDSFLATIESIWQEPLEEKWKIKLCNRFVTCIDINRRNRGEKNPTNQQKMPTLERHFNGLSTCEM